MEQSLASWIEAARTLMSVFGVHDADFAVLLVFPALIAALTVSRVVIVLATAVTLALLIYAAWIQHLNQSEFGVAIAFGMLALVALLGQARALRQRRVIAEIGDLRSQLAELQARHERDLLAAMHRSPPGRGAITPMHSDDAAIERRPPTIAADGRIP